jgi:hypothetical protein
VFHKFGFNGHLISKEPKRLCNEKEPNTSSKSIQKTRDDNKLLSKVSETPTTAQQLSGHAPSKKQQLSTWKRYEQHLPAYHTACNSHFMAPTWWQCSNSWVTCQARTTRIKFCSWAGCTLPIHLWNGQWRHLVPASNTSIWPKNTPIVPNSKPPYLAAA